ncbi:MAG: hypothetical protein WA211_16545 [Candidatus Acidiferrales bacterium]
MNFVVLGRIARGIGRPRNRPGAHTRTGIQEWRDQIPLENEAEHQKDQQSSDADVDSAGESATAAAGIAIVFDVAAGAAGCPTHGDLMTAAA